MPTRIRPNRLEVSDRFPMLGFTVRSDGDAKRFEIAIGASPDLFGPDGKAHRSRSNFYSTRVSGLLPIERGEAVYVLPAEVLSRFIGQQKLYYGLATSNNGPTSAAVASMPGTGSPYINISGLTGRSLQRVRLLPNRQRAASNYGKSGSELEWAGDMVAPGTQPAIPTQKTEQTKNGSAASAPAHYDDGYGPLPTPPPSTGTSNPQQIAQAKSFADDAASDSGEDSLHGIDGPIPDAGDVAAQGLAAGLSPEYPQASRFEPAASVNYRTVSGNRTISQVVIHITDGGSKINGTIGWFQNPNQRNAKGEPIHVSAHYVVGQDGEVVQMVKHNDVAWHASSANGNSIGIEHVANTRGLKPTSAQYCASAALVNWLCTQFNLSMDRQHILGHNEASPRDHHTGCPDAVWDWDYFMGMVTSGSCYAPESTASSSALDGNQSFDENWNETDVVGQPDDSSCWATAGAMVVGWRDRVSLNVDTIKQIFGDSTGLMTNAGLSPSDRQKLADALGLVSEPPQSYSVEGFRKMLENYGPAWVGIRTDDGWNHAVVVTGIYGDGTPDNTFVRIHDPWGRTAGAPTKPGSHNPTPGSGSRYTLTFSEFAKEYEQRITTTGNTVNVQILHAPDTGGRTISIGADQTYALAASFQTKHHHNRRPLTSNPRMPSSAAKSMGDDSASQPVQLPRAKRLSGWEKQVVRAAVENLASVAAPPVSVVFPQLFRLVNEQGYSIGLGLGGDAGVLGGAGAAFGVILAPNDDVGVFGSISINVGFAGLLAGLSAGARVIVMRGGIDAFNETTNAYGVTVDSEEGPSVSVIALLDGDNKFRGVSFQLGVGAALSPIQIFTGAEKSVAAAVTQGLAVSASTPAVPRQRPARALAQGASTTSGFGVADDARRTLKCIQRETEQNRPITFVVRYLLREMSLTETTALSNAGMPIVSCYESNQADPPITIYTRAKGKQDGRRAFAKAQEVGQPAGTPIYFAIDQDPANSRQVILDYFEGVREGCAQFLADMQAQGNDAPIYDIGVYGGSCALEWCRDQGIATWFWQAFAPAWCNGNNRQVWEGANIHTWTRQDAREDGKHLPCGTETFDRLEGWGNEGGWTVAAAAQGQALSVLPLAAPPPPKKRYAFGKALASAPRLIGNSPVNTVVGSDGNVSWELDQFPGIRMASASAVAAMQSAETIHLSNWPYCDHANGARACAWFAVDWKFSGQALGQVRIAPTGSQAGPYPLRVEARIEDGKNRDATTASLTVRLTYHFSTAEGPEVVAATDLILYSDGSLDQRSEWMAQAAA